MERSYCRSVVMVDGRRALQTNKKGFLYHLDDEIMENWIIFHKKEAAVNKKKWRKKGCKVTWQKTWGTQYQKRRGFLRCFSNLQICPSPSFGADCDT